MVANILCYFSFFRVANPDNLEDRIKVFGTLDFHGKMVILLYNLQEMSRMPITVDRCLYRCESPAELCFQKFGVFLKQ